MNDPTAIVATVTNMMNILMEVCEDDTSSEDDDCTNTKMIFEILRTSKNFEKEKVTRIVNYVEKTVVDYSSTQFQQHFRLTRAAYEDVLRKIGPNLQRKGCIGRETINIEKQVLSVIWLLATPDSYRSVSDRFNMGKSSLSVSFFRVVQALCNISHQEIVWPSKEKIEETKSKFKSLANLKNVIGAIDGTYIPIKAPKKDPEVYVTRKCQYAITLQAVCDTSLLFTDIFVGYPGSVSDTRIFYNSDLNVKVVENPNLYFPNNEFIIGDKAYPVMLWCIPPYIEHNLLSEAEIFFNNSHSKTRQVIERAFALFFGRFRRLKFLDMNSHHLIPHVVLASAVLHNICIRNNDINNEYIEEGSSNDFYNEHFNINDFLDFHNDAKSKRNQLSRELFLSKN